jgi:hypothetical protein
MVHGEGEGQLVNAEVEETPEMGRPEGDEEGDGQGDDAQAISGMGQDPDRGVDITMFERMKAAAERTVEVPEMQEKPWMRRVIRRDREAEGWR